MTTGIYALLFNGTDKVYIGQAVNIEKRFLRHLNTLQLELRLRRTKHKHPKLYSAFIKYGLPTLLILEKCGIENLNTNEIHWMEEFDSLNNGYNVCSGGASGRGVHNGSSIYSEAQILRAFDYLQNPENTYEYISKEVGIPISAISSIFTRSTHQWLEEKYPDKYYAMLNTSNARWTYSNKIGHHKLSAGAKNITYPDIIGPDGCIYRDIQNIREFALLHNIDPGNLIKVMNGKHLSCKGFKLKTLGDRVLRGTKIYGSILSPEGVLHKDISNIKAFSETQGLCSSSIGKVLRGTKTSHKGWRLA
jgi:hypothetical protein